MRLIFASIILALSAGLAHAADPTCEAKAIDKNGKALAGAAKAASIKKCEKTAGGSACAAKAIDKNGKALAGAAKAASIKKCEKEGAAPAAAASGASK